MIKIQRSFFILSMIAISAVSCKKDGNPFQNVPDEDRSASEWVDLVDVKDKAGDIQYYSKGNSSVYPIELDRASGYIQLTLSAEGELMSSRMSRNLYNTMVKNYGAEKVGSLPQSLLYYANKMNKKGFQFYNSPNFIPPMSKQAFDRKFKDCIKKPTNTGVLLCTIHLVMEAVMDCLNADPDKQHIHCW